MLSQSPIKHKVIYSILHTYPQAILKLAIPASFTYKVNNNMPLAKLKTKIIAREYLNNGLNATQAVRKYKPNYSIETANVAGHRLLVSDKFKRSIEEVMEEQGITDAMLLREHTKVIKQDKHLPSKNGALDMAYKLKGSYAPEKKAILTIPANKIDETIKELLQEYRKLGRVETDHLLDDIDPKDLPF